MNKRSDKGIAGPLAAALLFMLSLASCGVNMIPTKDAWFTQHYIIMQDFERDTYRGLSAAGRQGYQDLFWKYRSAEARSMFEVRLEYVKKNYWRENSQQPWNSDRGRTYILNGSPASIDIDQNSSWPTAGLPSSFLKAQDRSNEDVAADRAEVWTYPYDKYFIRYIFAFVQPNQWKMTQSTGSRYLGEFETYNKTVVFGIRDVQAYKQELAGLEKRK
jgi:GWxTD domain-containing protein